MDKLIVLTFSDKPLPEDNYLKRTCEQQRLTLKVITHTPWEFNAIKIKLLYEWLPGISKDTLVLVTDAFDVAIYDDEKAILEKYREMEGDIVFSAESNFYFRNKKLIKHYWKTYPRQHTIYDYLNSGTYIGRAGDLSKMIEAMVENEDISLDPESLRVTRSDQYAFSKHYVDAYYLKNAPIIRLDHHQKLMGCSGGRFAVIPFPDLSKMQSFLFFLIERNILKVFKLHKYQNQSKDFQIKDERFFNGKTKEFPSVIHLPGTWDNFNLVIGKFLAREHRLTRHPIAFFISLLSFILSIVLGLFLFFPKGRS